MFRNCRHYASVRDRGVGGSNPLAATKNSRSVLVGLVTLYSERMGNSFDPNGVMFHASAD